MKLKISELSTPGDGPILVCDEEMNDIAEFYHNEHATVGQSYETALMLARTLVEAVNTHAPTEANSAFIDIVFDGPGGPEGGRFVEVEDASGCSISIGEWINRSDGYWVLRLAELDRNDGVKR